MSLTAILPWKKEAMWQHSGRKALAMHGLEDNGKTIPFEMDIHIPCFAKGITTTGSIWEGQATTLSIGSFGARLLLPAEARLDGDITLSFRVPPPLAFLFPDKKFKAIAEVKTFGTVDPGISTNGKMVVCIVFTESLYFNLREEVTYA